MHPKHQLIPRSFWSFPYVFDEEEGGSLQEFSEWSGLSVSEDDRHIYVEASVPGIKPEEIEMTFEKGILWIKAEKKEEVKDNKKKYYRRAMNQFSYRLAVPGNIDENKQPEATCKNGVLKVTFTKTQKSEPRKIPIKGE
jgi:HSP20 family protein